MQVQTVLVMMLRFLIYSPIMCIGGIIMAVSKDKQLTLILAVVLSLLFALILTLAGVVVPLFVAMQKKLERPILQTSFNLRWLRRNAFLKCWTRPRRFRPEDAPVINYPKGEVKFEHVK